MALVNTNSEVPKPVEKYNLLDLKVAADEQVAKYFKAKGFEENHMFLDVKLILGYMGAIIALADFLMTWKKEFKTVRNVSLISSLSYFIISGIQYLWVHFAQGKTIYQGKSPNKDGEYSFQSHHKVDASGQPIYEVSLRYEQPDNSSEAKSIKEVKAVYNFGSIFNEDGVLSIPHFYSKLNALFEELEPKSKAQ